MSLLVIASTAREIEPFLKKLRSGQFQREIDVLLTGIGILSTTYALTRQVWLKRPARVIQAGIAGCFERSVPLGAVVAVKKDLVADTGVEENKQWKTLGDLKLLSPHEAPYQKGWLVNQSPLLQATHLKKTAAITINEITTRNKRIRQYAERYKPMVESMEGAALHYVCLKEQIPFLQLRSISNYTGERNKQRWDLDKSIKNLNAELVYLIESLQDE